MTESSIDIHGHANSQLAVQFWRRPIDFVSF